MSLYVDTIMAQLQAFGLSELSQTIEKARAYYENKPYPQYGLWPLVDGEQVYPKVVVTIPKIIVNKSATFLMKKRPTFYVKDSPEATEFISKIIEENEIDLLSIAKTAGLEGGIWFKFYIESDNKNPWRVSVLSQAEVVATYDPHNIKKLLGVRVQYQYLRGDGSAWWYREDWTDSTYSVYQEVSASLLEQRGISEHWQEGIAKDQTPSPWKIAFVAPNDFGVIPFQYVRNCVDPLNPLGLGDFWDLFDLFDRINVAYDSMDRSNQFGGGPVAVFKEADDAPSQLVPHQSYSISGPNADVIMLQDNGNLRGPMEAYANKLESFAYSAAQIVNPKLEDVAGLGQLSYAALQLLHGPLIELTDAKRPYWGTWGLCKFFEKLLSAADRYAAPGRIAGGSDMTVIADWPDYFPLGGVDKQIELTNIGTAKQQGLPIEDSVRWLAKIVGIPNEELGEFLKRAQADAETQAQIAQATTMLKQITGGLSGNTKPGLPNQAVDGSSKGAARKKNAQD